MVAGSPPQGVPALVAPIDLTEGGWDLEQFIQEQIERYGLFVLRAIKSDPDQEPGPATKRAKHVVKVEPHDSADGSSMYRQPDKDPEVPDG